MLSDIERKVLRIIANFSVGRRRTPTVDELCVKTRRSRSGVMEVLAALAREKSIEWMRSSPGRHHIAGGVGKKGVNKLESKIG
jgi:hypothetical protein